MSYFYVFNLSVLHTLQRVREDLSDCDATTPVYAGPARAVVLDELLSAPRCGDDIRCPQFWPTTSLTTRFTSTADEENS